MNRDSRGGARHGCRGSRLAAAVCAAALCAAAAVPAGAQVDMKRVTDVNNRFSIAFPPRWTAVSEQLNTKVLTTEVPVATLPQNNVSQSIMIAAGPPENFQTPPRLIVMPLDLPRPLTVDELGSEVQQRMPPSGTSFAVTSQGFATIAGRRAYYVYFTGVSGAAQPVPLYGVLVYMADGREGFLIIGMTLNDPDRIRRDFSTISAILETFRILPHQAAVLRGVQALRQPAAAGRR